MNDVKLSELLRIAFADPRVSEAAANEIVSMLDDGAKHKLYSFLSIKAVANIKAQMAKLDEALERYNGIDSRTNN